VITKWLWEQNIDILGPWPGNSTDLKTSYSLNPVNGIDLTTASESAGRQIQTTLVS
jgi:hypothetical protein